jgi:hypothetical protein
MFLGLLAIFRDFLVVYFAFLVLLTKEHRFLSARKIYCINRKTLEQLTVWKDKMRIIYLTTLTKSRHVYSVFLNEKASHQFIQGRELVLFY